MVVSSLVMFTRLALPSIWDGDILELDAEIFGNHLTAGQDGDVLEHGLAAVAEAGRFDRRHFQAAAQLVDDERGEGFALHVLGNHEERTTRLDHRLKKRQHGLKA